MASIEKLGPNRWRVGVRLPVSQGRKWIRRTLTFPQDVDEGMQRKQVDLAAAQLEVEVASGQGQRDRRTTVGEFAETWMRQHVIPNCKPTTAATYRNFLDARIIPQLGDVALADLDSMRLTVFINSLREQPARTTAIPAPQRKRRADRERPDPPPRTLAPSTVRHYYDCLRDMLNAAVRWHVISTNPIYDVVRPKVPRRRVHYLDDRSAVQLLRCLAEEESLPLRCAVLLALTCGLRLSEVGALQLSDVNWEDCSIHISRGLNYTPAAGSYMDTPKSEAGDRDIDLPAGMMALLDETRKYHEDAAAALGDRWRGCGRIISNWDGTPVHHDTPSKWFRRFADAHGFRGVRFHDLRHTHATLLFANNLDAVAVASRLGHSDASVTLRIYAHAIRSRDKQAAAAMQDLLDAAQDTPQQ